MKCCIGGSALDRIRGRLRQLSAVIFPLLIGLISGVAAANPQDFSGWLDGLRDEARANGISEATISIALGDIVPVPRVIELDRNQPESTLRFEEYLARLVTEERIRDGRALMAENASLLQQVAQRYGVEPRFIVALWGVESDYGRRTGAFNVLAALATLAYDGRRAAYFRKELLQALRIVDEGHISPAAMTGSWAGAMGQNQFMPSSFLDFAVDFDGDGRRNIWSSRADVFASIANYLSRAGWQTHQGWGRQVRIAATFDQSLIGLEQRRTLAEWSRLGLVQADGSPLPTSELNASLAQPAGRGGAVYLAYDNYRVILRWNRSLYFATAVGTLADRLGGS
ncbi:MAG TPA: lytic murein transglycosylase [Alphaproteobacteria bacterium]|nr:lytic murein transglycosylase [Alphaproteobacteria bacterium]